MTGSASGITETTAVINATVNPNRGAVTECNLEYGTSETYGASAPCSPSPGSGHSPVAVSASVTGLSANTSYQFRVVATNAYGTTYGQGRSFRTRSAPPTITAISPTSGAIGSPVTITGTNLTGTEDVRFSGNGQQTGAGYSVESNTSIRTYVPIGAMNGPITVTTSGGGKATSSEEFTVLPVLPEFGRCARTAKGAGTFSSAKCTKLKAGGGFEWLPGTAGGGTFDTKLSGGVATFQTVGGRRSFAAARPAPATTRAPERWSAL